MMKKFLLSYVLLIVSIFSVTGQEKIPVNPPREEVPVAILAIGNSFSEDAVEQYLSQICESEGKKVVIGNLYIPGCSLEKHYTNAVNNIEEYRFRVISPDGEMSELQNVSLATALDYLPWNYVSFQQASHYSGQYGTYQYLAPLMEMVRRQVGDESTFMWHMTWAYSTDSDHSGYAFYDNSQPTMYQAILGAAQNALDDNPELEILIPSGTAIQNARKTVEAGDDLTRDGYHLDLREGRYIAGLTWFESIFKQKPDDNLFVPEGIDPETLEAIKAAVAEAVANPFPN